MVVSLACPNRRSESKSIGLSYFKKGDQTTMADHLHFDARTSTMILRKQKPRALGKMPPAECDKLIIEFTRQASLVGGKAVVANMLADWPGLPTARLSSSLSPAIAHQDCRGMTALLFATWMALGAVGPTRQQGKAKLNHPPQDMIPWIRAVEVLAQRSDQAARCQYGCDALRLAALSRCELGGMRMLAALLPRGNPEAACRNGRRALDAAIEMGSGRSMIEALAAVTNLDHKAAGMTALERAAMTPNRSEAWMAISRIRADKESLSLEEALGKAGPSVPKSAPRL